MYEKQSTVNNSQNGKPGPKPSMGSKFSYLETTCVTHKSKALDVGSSNFEY